jgi:hypothetical protein
MKPQVNNISALLEFDITEGIKNFMDGVFNTIQKVFTAFETSAGYIIYFAQLLICIGILVVILMSINMIEKYFFRPCIWICENVFHCKFPSRPCIQFGCCNNSISNKRHTRHDEQQNADSETIDMSNLNDKVLNNEIINNETFNNFDSVICDDITSTI